MKKNKNKKETAKSLALKDMKKDHIFPIIPEKRNFENGVIIFMQ